VKYAYIPVIITKTKVKNAVPNPESLKIIIERKPRIANAADEKIRIEMIKSVRTLAYLSINMKKTKRFLWLNTFFKSTAKTIRETATEK